MFPGPGRLVAYTVAFAAVFVADLLAPLGINIPLLYLLPLLAALVWERVHVRYLLVALAGLLTCSKLVWLWTEPWGLALANRLLDLGVFGTALIMSIRDSRTRAELEDLRLAVESSTCVTVLDLQGRIEHVNDRYLAVTGLHSSGLVGQSWIAAHQSAPVVASAWRTLQTGRIWHGEVAGTTASGTPYWLDVTAVPMLDHHQRPLRFLVLGTDLSQTKRTEARLRHQTALARIGELAAVLAHQIRNPLAGVGAALQIVASRPTLVAADRQVLTKMRERLESLNTHVTDLLQFTRMRSPQIRAVRLAQVLAEVLQRYDGTGSGLTRNLEGPDLVVAGDGALLREAFSHLFDNAIRAAGDRGAVHITIRATNGLADVRIRDTGSGIPSDLVERVFEPLFTTTGGSGLGLPIARQLVELHAGVLDIASTSCSGTEVRVLLPLVAAHTSIDGATEPESEALGCL